MNLVFIIGTGRGGSSFVHEVLAKHEDFGFVSNIEDNFPRINTYGKWNNKLYGSALGKYTKKGGLRFAPSEAYNLISKEVSVIYANSNRDLLAQDVTPYLANRFQTFFETRNQAQQKKVFSHKYTGWPRIGFFQEIFPEAKFINIVRDGRAVANSWLQMDWWGGYRGPKQWLWRDLTSDEYSQWAKHNHSYPFLAGMSWKILMDAFHQAEESLNPENYLKLRYEDILQDPRKAFESMTDFCNLEWTARFNTKFEKQQIKAGRSTAYKRDLTSEQLQDVEVPINHLLEQYGYK